MKENKRYRNKTYPVESVITQANQRMNSFIETRTYPLDGVLYDANQLLTRLSRQEEIVIADFSDIDRASGLTRDQEYALRQQSIKRNKKLQILREAHKKEQTKKPHNYSE